MPLDPNVVPYAVGSAITIVTGAGFDAQASVILPAGQVMP